jgi:hypothetical protein
MGKEDARNDFHLLMNINQYARCVELEECKAVKILVKECSHHVRYNLIVHVNKSQDHDNDTSVYIDDSNCNLTVYVSSALSTGSY